MSNFNLFKKIHLPINKTSIYIAFILCFVDIIKELPITLILRPFNFETFATKAYASYSHAEGNQTIASGSSSHAEGQGSAAVGSYSHAEGYLTISSGSYSHAEGYGTIALGDRQHVTGQYNFVSPVQSAFIVGNGIDDSNRNNLIYAAENAVEISGSLNVNGSLIVNEIIKGTGSIYLQPDVNDARYFQIYN